MPKQIKTTPSAAEAFAFEHLDNLASVLHQAGHRDMGLLLDGMGDLHRIAQRRAAKGDGAELLAKRDDTTDYVLDQLADLAKMMEEHGLADAAMLLRMPAKLQAAADRRRKGEGAAIYVLPTTRVAPSSRPAFDAAIAVARRVG